MERKGECCLPPRKEDRLDRRDNLLLTTSLFFPVIFEETIHHGFPYKILSRLIPFRTLFSLTKLLKPNFYRYRRGRFVLKNIIHV